jgi:hypothetical protein
MHAPFALPSALPDSLIRSLAVRARALPEGCPVPPQLLALAQLVAQHCAQIGDRYANGLGDATAGEHIRAVFDL